MGQLKDIDSIVDNLSELKGMPQKLGQIISMDFSEYIPPELREKFSKLQSQSQAIEALQILEIIQKELGALKFNQVTRFEPTPLGAGSIGQVHSASIDNKRVVFKVRYPEIEKQLKLIFPSCYRLPKLMNCFAPNLKTSRSS